MTNSPDIVRVLGAFVAKIVVAHRNFCLSEKNGEDLC